MKYLAVIPARYQSSRFPGKPLIDIGGRSMISRVYQQAKKSTYLDEVVVATDDELIYDHCMNANMRVIMTSPAHLSGTDRVAEVATSIDAEVIINIQGDEPFISPAYIDILCSEFADGQNDIATLVTPIDDVEFFHSPNIVKVVRRTDGRALYFSRAAIPFKRNHQFQVTIFRHLGIYGFRRKVLLQLSSLDPGSLERSEMLEQLRWLEAGYEIQTCIVDAAPLGIDVPDDVEKIIQWMKINRLD